MGNPRAKVLILYTGGTFGMEADTLAIPNLGPQALKKRLLRHVPELLMLADCEVRVEMNRDSAHIGPREWVRISQTIQELWDSYDGIVVLHGTDTLAYSASALSFLLRPCRKPVILTGAQRPLAAIRSDARRNLVSAVELAAFGVGSRQRRLSEVGVFFNEVLFRGNRVRKRSAVDFSGFESPKSGVLARVGSSIQVHGPWGSPKVPSRAVGSRLKPQFSSRIGMLHLTPGFPASAMDPMLSKLEGLVLVAFPSGTAPTHQREFHRMLAQAHRRSLPVIVVTEGVGISGSEYRAGKEMLDAGCLWSGAMTPECAYVKASYLLGQEDGRKALARWWSVDLANEGAAFER